MRFAICDDNREHINHLQALFDARQELNIDTEPYESGEELVADYKYNGRRFDALFIDIEMERMNGIDTANAIRKMDDKVLIVFVTSYTQYMQACFQCSPFRFLNKPVQEEAFNETLNAIMQRLSEKRIAINFTANKMQVRLYCDEILYCECHDHRLKIVTRETSYQLYKTIAEIGALLDPDMFARAHKAFLVNLRHVRMVSGSHVLLRHCDVEIPLGRTYKEQFLRAYTVQKMRELCL